MDKIEYQSNGQPVAVCFEDLLKKLGYKRYTPKIGTLGRALLKASKNQRSDNFLKRYWDSYYKKLRQQRKGQNKKK